MSELRTASPSSTGIIIEVDTHKFVHVAVAIDHLGTRLASCSVSADRAGYAELVVWARTLGHIDACAVESTGSYGVGLASDVRRQALRVVEVSHCDRRKRRNNGKSDTLDAESAARSVLAGLATAVPKSADGAAEMVRQIKVARDTAVKARSAAIIALKTLLVNAPCELRRVPAAADRPQADRSVCPPPSRRPRRHHRVDQAPFVAWPRAGWHSPAKSKHMTRGSTRSRWQRPRHFARRSASERTPWRR
jgi:transposase